jgi:cell wall-associated NlpC family hydrolase
VYGGTSLTNGADCSGFTMRIFEHFGIDTGRSSRDQAAKAKTISINDIQPGDLLFYASGDYINHVALYIGGGQIIHASNSKTGIIISTAYYRTPYKAATFLN